MLHSERCDSVELNPQILHCIDAEEDLKYPATHRSDSPVFDLSLKLVTLVKRNQELLYINSKWAQQYDILRRDYEKESAVRVEAEMKIQSLQIHCETLTRTVQQQEREIKRLNNTLLMVLRSSESQLDCSTKIQEDIWRHQAEVYKEDFMKERKDREKLKEKYAKLENRFKKMYCELRALKTQTQWGSPSVNLPPQKISSEAAPQKV